MTRFVSTSIALACALALFGAFAFIGCSSPAGTGNTNTKMAAFDCRGKPAATIVDQMYSLLESNGYKDQYRQFHITATPANPPAAQNAVVKIVGYSGNIVQIRELLTKEDLVRYCTLDDRLFFGNQSEFGTNSDVDNKYLMRIGCPPDTGPCGDICIPLTEVCKLTGAKPTAPEFACTVRKGKDSPTSLPEGNVNGKSPKR